MGYLPDYIIESHFDREEHKIIIINNNLKFNIFIKYYSKDTVDFDIIKFKRYFELLYDELDHMIKYKRKVINVKYYQTFNKKYLPLDKYDKITCNNINSGLCYIYSSEKDINIIIHRKEEFFKVLIHELLHLYNIIPYDNNSYEYEKSQHLLYGHDLDINMNESLVELNALILNCIVIHKISKIPFYNLIKREYIYSILTTKKLFNHFEIKKFSDIEIKWKETTHAFSYFIIKTLLLSNILNDSIDIINESDINNINDTFLINKNNIRMTINDVDKFL